AFPGWLVRRSPPRSIPTGSLLLEGCDAVCVCAPLRAPSDHGAGEARVLETRRQSPRLAGRFARCAPGRARAHAAGLLGFSAGVSAICTSGTDGEPRGNRRAAKTRDG